MQARRRRRKRFSKLQKLHSSFYNIVKFVNDNVNELSIRFRPPTSHLKEYRRDEHTGPFVATVL